MRILYINSVPNGSTGKICRDLYDLAIENGFDCCIAYGRGNIDSKYNSIRIGNNFDVYQHVLKTRVFDRHGLESKKATKSFLKEVSIFNPDIIHLHNIHGYYINIPLLFEYFKENPDIKIIWTLHDCWSFTGHCAYFTYSGCEKWQVQCKNCVSKKEYPSSLVFDNSKINYAWKKDLFSKVGNMTLVTPSAWLQHLVRKSFLKKFPCKIIHNGINTSIFKKKNIVKQDAKTIILGVANIWDKRKGLNYFIDLYNILDKDKYKIVLVGVAEEQMDKLPKDIIKLKKTNNLEELVDLYNSAEVLFNPTLEDNYPTVNLEAQACGTPVLTFDSGGSAETLISTSRVVKDVEEVKQILEKETKIKLDFEIDLLKIEAKYLFKEYIDLYKEVLGGVK